MAHRFRRREVLKFFREQCQSHRRDDLVAGLLTGPDGATELAGIVADTSARRKTRGGSAAAQGIWSSSDGRHGPDSMRAQRAVGCVASENALNYWKAHFLSDLSDGGIEAIVACFEKCPSPMSQIVIENFHGRPRAWASPIPPARSGRRASTSC